MGGNLKEYKRIKLGDQEVQVYTLEPVAVGASTSNNIDIPLGAKALDVPDFMETKVQKIVHKDVRGIEDFDIKLSVPVEPVEVPEFMHDKLKPTTKVDLKPKDMASIDISLGAEVCTVKNSVEVDKLPTKASKVYSRMLAFLEKNPKPAEDNNTMDMF